MVLCVSSSDSVVLKSRTPQHLPKMVDSPYSGLMESSVELLDFYWCHLSRYHQKGAEMSQHGDKKTLKLNNLIMHVTWLNFEGVAFSESSSLVSIHDTILYMICITYISTWSCSHRNDAKTSFRLNPQEASGNNDDSARNPWELGSSGVVIH